MTAANPTREFIPDGSNIKGDVVVNDSFRGVKTYMHHEDDGRMRFTTVQDAKVAEAISDRAQALRGKADLVGTQKHLLHLADIPIPIYRLWYSILGSPRQNQKAWLRRIQDSDFSKFRVEERNVV